MKKSPKAKKSIFMAALVAASLFMFVLSLALGSVSVAFGDTLRIILNGLTGAPQTGLSASDVSIILATRLPRVAAAALCGAMLSVAGAAMQGLLRNPLADGSTLGVSAGAGLGAVVYIAFAPAIAFLPDWGVKVNAVIFAFLSILIILVFSFRMDASLSSETVILAGIVFSMLASSLISLITVFQSDKLHSIIFWTFGSFSGISGDDCLLLFVTLVVCGAVILFLYRELNAFAFGEESASAIGVNVRAVRIIILLLVSAMIGISTAVCGQVAFVGLITPHIVRRLTGPDHRILLPAAVFGGAAFVMLSDLLARTLFSPRELPTGVITSIAGAIIFLTVFLSRRRKRA